MAGNDRRLGDVELAQQRRVRPVEPEDDGVRIGRLDRLDRGGKAGAGARVEAEQGLFEAELDIGRRERLAVVPAHASRQVKGHCAPVRGQFPRAGQIGAWCAVSVERHEAVVERAGDGV